MYVALHASCIVCHGEEKISNVPELFVPRRYVSAKTFGNQRSPFFPYLLSGVSEV